LSSLQSNSLCSAFESHRRLSASQGLCLVLSSSWTDYNRVLDDAANGLFATLAALEAADSGFCSRINAVVFNNVSKTGSKPSNLCGSPCALPFTPSAPTKAGIADILAHLLVMATQEALPFRRFFAGDNASFASLAAFTARYASGVATFADSVWTHCQAAGVPVVCAPASEPQRATSAQLKAVATRLFA